MKPTALLLLILLLAPAAFTQATDRYDLVINNARIVDGTGNPWFRGAIGILDGKIATISRFDLPNAETTIDARNHIVAPGFIDVHAHTEDIFDNPTAENFIRMGVTSLVTGNCGGSVTDVGEFLGRFHEKPLAVNLATLIAHGSVRSKVMGLDNRAPTPEEQQKMNALVEQGMK